MISKQTSLINHHPKAINPCGLLNKFHTKKKEQKKLTVKPVKDPIKKIKQESFLFFF